MVGGLVQEKMPHKLSGPNGSKYLWTRGLFQQRLTQFIPLSWNFFFFSWLLDSLPWFSIFLTGPSFPVSWDSYVSSHLLNVDVQSMFSPLLNLYYSLGSFTRPRDLQCHPWNLCLQPLPWVPTIRWFIRNLHLVLQMTKMYFSYLFGLCPHFLAHSSPNPRSFLSGKSSGSIFGYIVWSLVLNSSRSIRVKEYLVVHNKPLSTTSEFMLMR